MSLVSNNSNIFHINSTKRLSGTNSSFVYKVNGASLDDYDRISLLQISVPKTFYMVNAPRNTFTLKEDANEFIVTLPEANYNSISFIAILPSLLDGLGAFTYSMTRPNKLTEPDTGLYTFSVTGAGGSTVSFIFPSNSEIATLCGFEKGSTNTFDGGSLVSTKPFFFQIEQTIFLNSDVVDIRGGDSILQELLAVRTDSGGSIVFQQSDIDSNSRRFRSTRTDTFNFYLVDEDGNEINMRGQNIVFSILLYKRNNIYQVTKAFFKIVIDFMEGVTSFLSG